MKRTMLLGIILVITISAQTATNPTFYGKIKGAIWLNNATSTEPMEMVLYSNSRVGANWSLDNLTAKAEFGIGPSLRVFSVAMKSDDTEIKVGQDYITGFDFFFNQCSTEAFNSDGPITNPLFMGRSPLVSVSHGNANITVANKIPIDPIGTGDMKSLPRLIGSYKIQLGETSIQPVVATSYWYNGDNKYYAGVGAVNMTSQIGPIGVMGQGWYGQNVSDLGIYVMTGSGASVADDAVQVYGGSGQITYNAISLGGGYLKNEHDADAGGVFANWCVPISSTDKGYKMKLTPEVGYFWGSFVPDEILYGGIFLQIDF